MAELSDPHRSDPHRTDRADRHDRRGSGRSGERIHLSGLFWSLVFLVVAAVGLTGTYGWISHPTTRWVAAGGIAVIGVGLLLTALPRRPRD